MLKLFTAVLIAAAAASAADITGMWKGTADTPNGTIERTFVFKQDGTKLTGDSTSEYNGKSEITEGKVEGDTVSFTLNMRFQDNEAKVKYTGKVDGNQMKLAAEIPMNGGMKVEYTAKKVE